MAEKKIDITSTALEKGIDLAKNFLDKLITPAVEETGLLLKDKVTFWKFKNQVKILNKAKDYCEKNNISTKTIPLKLLCPLLDYSGIEEDEVLQDKWAILLSNLIDSEQNIQNHVFPYILSQISVKEFSELEKVYIKKNKEKSNLTKELEELKKNGNKTKIKLKQKITELNSQIENTDISTQTLVELQGKKSEASRQLNILDSTKRRIEFDISKPIQISPNTLKEFELSNVIRLGLVKIEKEYSTRSQRAEVQETHRFANNYVDIEIDIDSSEEIILTELGELFISACQEKKSR